MAAPLSAAVLLAALEAEGCTVREYGSWKTHNRNHMGAWGSVHGVMIHHTVTSGTDASVRLCYQGRAGLPGPLCHTVGAKDGTLYMVGHGRANHAGMGDDDVLNAVINETALPADNEASVDGNARFYGIELINLGNGRDPWPEAQVDAAARWAAAICRKHGWSERSVIGHLEWQPGKVDPRPTPGSADISMDAFRARVKTLLAGPAGGTTPDDDQQQENDVPANLSLGLKKDTPLKTDSWMTLSWDTEYGDPLGEHYMPGGQTFVAGPGRYTGAAYLRFTDLAAGATVQARLVEDDDSGKTVQVHPIGEQTGSEGDTFYAFPITGYVAKGRRVKLQVAQFSGTSCTVADSYLKALVWNA